MSKGVVSDVWPDENMPVDKHGIRAEVIVKPDSPFARMNTSQLLNQFFARGCELMKQRLVNGELGNTTEGSFEAIMEFINDIRPNYAQLIRSGIKDVSDMEEFLESVRTDGIYLCIPPFLNYNIEELIPFLEKKYKIHDEHVTYYTVNSDGTREKKVSEEKICIGPKYMYLLGKIPQDMITCVEMGYVSQFNTPIKPKSIQAKQRSPIKHTPIRLGEDETSVLNMSLGPDDVFRLMCIYSSSPASVKKLQTELLTNPNPTRLKDIGMELKELVDTNINITLFKHMMGIIGLTYNDSKEEK